MRIHAKGSKLRRIMKRFLHIFLFLSFSLVGISQNPYGNQIFIPAITFTATGQTSSPIALAKASWSMCSISITGTALTTATFGVLGSADGGVTYGVIPIATPATQTTDSTVTVTASGGPYQFNCGTLTHVEFVTSGTFTATNISLTLTASPNAQIGRGNATSLQGTPLAAIAPTPGQSLKFNGTSYVANVPNFSSVVGIGTSIVVNVGSTNPYRYGTLSLLSSGTTMSALRQTLG
jgi:hypothetical protein